MGVKLYATDGTAQFLIRQGIEPEVLNWPDGESPTALDYIMENKIDLVVNIPKDYQEAELTNDYLIRRTAVDFGVPLMTNTQAAERLVEALCRNPINALKVRRWRNYNG